MTVTEQIITIAIIAGVTLLTRLLPFLVFSSNKPTPKFLRYLGAVLPPAVFGMLLVYCLKGVSLVSYPYALPELIGVGCVVLVHLLFRKMLVSIGVGSAVYLVLVNLIF